MSELISLLLIIIGGIAGIFVLLLAAVVLLGAIAHAMLARDDRHLNKGSERKEDAK